MYLEWLELQSGLKSEKSCNLGKPHCLPHRLNSPLLDFFQLCGTQRPFDWSNNF